MLAETVRLLARVYELSDNLGGMAAFSCANGSSSAAPLRLSVGVQLWSVREQLKKDFSATLRELHSIGYREVELFELPPSPRQFRTQVEAAGLTFVSGHFELMSFRNPAVVAAVQELGLKYMILVFPELRARKGQSVDQNFQPFVPRYEDISLADYQWNADQLNKCGPNLKQHGIKAGYHNHAIDLKNLGNGQRGLDYLIQRRYPERMELLHLKDLVRGYQISTSLDTEERDRNSEIGSGVIDWKKFFEAASSAGHVKHYFIEHEGRMDNPPLEALRNSYNYLQTLKT